MEKKFSLLLVTYNFPPQRGGIETLCYQLVSKLDRSVVVCAPAQIGDREFDQKQSFSTCRISSPRSTLLRSLCFLPHIFSILKQGGVDHILCANNFAALPVYFLARLFRVPYSILALGQEVTILNTPLRSPMYKSVMKVLYQGAAQVLSISQFTKNQLVQFGLDGSKIPTITLGFEPPEEADGIGKFARLQKKLKGKTVLLTLARLVERKGHDRVIEALKRVQQTNPDVEYIIVGTGPNEETLRKLSHELGISDSVHFLGSVGDRDLPEIFSLSDIFIMPSRYIKEKADAEGFGLVFLEANYYGLPVIGGRSGGIPDAIEEGKSGYLVDPNSVSELAEKIKYLIEHPEEGKCLADYGKKRVLEEFNFDRTRLQLKEILFGNS